MKDEAKAPPRIAVLGSGAGSNFRAIAEAIQGGLLDAQIALVVSDVPGAGILRLAMEFEAQTLCLPVSKFKSKLEPEIESDLAAELLERTVDLVVLAGFMRLLKEPLIAAFPRRIINIHPSLLPKFPGLEAWRQALEAGESEAGCTVHYVDRGMDTGEIIAQERVPILPGDDAAALHARIQAAEHRLYPRVIGEFAAALGQKGGRDAIRPLAN
jgi:phosphoribosylglycinamide formyltransferase-1